MSCSAIQPGQVLKWSIRLNSSPNVIQFPSVRLNGCGFYQYADSEGIYLTINNTMDNNGTSIRCIDEAPDDVPTVHETNLHVFGKYYRIEYCRLSPHKI